MKATSADGSPTPLRLAAATDLAFAEWLRPHLPALTAVAQRQVGFTHRDDLVQETILQAWRQRARYDPHRGSPRSWLMIILLSKCRRHRVRMPWLARPPAALAEGDTEKSAASEELERAIEQLSRRQHQVVVLHYLADLSVAEVARVLELSESSVKTHLQYARSALRTKLRGDEGGY